MAALICGGAVAFAIVNGFGAVVPFLFVLPLLVLLPSQAVIGGLIVLISTGSWLDYRLLGGRFESVVTVPIVVASGLLFLWFLSLMIRRVRLVVSATAIWFSAFLGANLASTLWNYPGLHARHMMLGNVLHLMNFGVLLVTSSVIGSERINRRRAAALILIGLGVASVGAALSQISAFLESSRVLWKTNPAYTVSLDKGALGGFGAVVSLTALCLFLELKRKRLKLLSFLLVPLGAAIDLLAWQRVQFVALFGGIAAVALVRGVRFAAALVVLLSVVIALAPSVPAAVDAVFTFQPVSFEARVQFWRDAFDVWVKHPVLGIGPSQYRQGASWTHPHNQYLTIAAETGTVGLGAFLAVMAILGWESVTAYRRANDPLLKAMSLAVIGLVAQQAVAGLGEPALLPIYGRNQFVSFTYSMYFWALVGLMVGLKRGPSPPE